MEIVGDRREGLRGAAIVGGVIVAVGTLLCLLGPAVGMAHSFHAIETIKTPTPDDLAVGVRISFATTIAGLVISFVGALVLLVAFLRLSLAGASSKPG